MWHRRVKETVVEREKNGKSRIGGEWEGERWEGIERPYTADDVARLRGSIRIEHTLARLGAERLWTLMNERPFVRALGALTGNQAVQQVKAGLDAIYLSGWQVAADANLSGHMYPDQSLYPANSVPHVVRRINQALQRADQIHHSEGRNGTNWFAPIVADAEAANLITSDVDPTDHEFLTGERTMEGFYRVNAGIGQAISRGLSYAPYADVVWCETSEPNLEQAQRFAEAIHEKFPGKLLAYNCSPSFNWKKKLSEQEISRFKEEL